MISGEVSKAILYHDVPFVAGQDKMRVIDNPNSGSKIRFTGEALINPSTTVGFIMELGYDETKGVGLGIATDDMTVRHSAVYMNTALGKVTLGRTSTATDGIVEIDTSNANIASLPLSLEPIYTYSGIGGLLGGLLNPVAFDGGRANVIRYDSPALAGFTASASWGGGQSASADDIWDIALRYAGEFGGFRVAAGIGHRVESFDTFSVSEMRTTAGSASAKHVLTGLFLTAAAGQQSDHPLFGDVQMWQVRGGIERNWFGIGNTTLFAEYGDHKLKTFSVDSTFYGVGMVQAIDAAAADVFIAYRAYDIGGVFDASTVFGGLRIKF
jgi:predicted porin